MSKTIVQAYGPIYGEPVNGTVQGRPNGSVFVPLTNKITLSVDDNYFKLWTHSDGNTYFGVSNSSGVRNRKYYAVAEAQDLSSNMVVRIFSDSALTNLVGEHSFAAGQFNRNTFNVLALDTTGLQAGDTLYFCAQLLNNNVPVATSTVISMELV